MQEKEKLKVNKKENGRRSSRSRSRSRKRKRRKRLACVLGQTPGLMDSGDKSLQGYPRQIPARLAQSSMTNFSIEVWEQFGKSVQCSYPVSL